MTSSPEAGDPHLWAVILAGGIGSRFWPASTPARPKQLLRLASDRPLIRETLDRITPLVPLERIRILTGAALAGPIAEALPELGPGNFLLEPRAAGTAPVLAWAAAEIERRDPDAVMISLHADHVIHPAETFRARIEHTARLAAAHRRLFTIGAVPTRPETGYGYVRPGDALPAVPELGGEPGRAVDAFVEKPDVDTARDYVGRGYLWNTGLFVWRAADLLDEIEARTPELAGLIPVVREGGVDEFFRRAPNLSVDEGVLERSERVAVVPSDFAWDDVGAWDAMFRTRPADADGNVVVGEGYPVDSARSALYAEDGPIVAFGVDDLVIVRTSGVTFVAHRERTPDLKSLLARIPEALRTLD